MDRADLMKWGMLLAGAALVLLSVCARVAVAAAAAPPPPAGSCEMVAGVCAALCMVSPEATPEVDMAGARSTCGCDASLAPGAEAADGALMPPGVSGPAAPPRNLTGALDLEAAVVDRLCATSLRPWWEWTEDARRAEISATSITLFDVTDHVHYTPLCHALCGGTCGGVSLLGASSTLAADVGLGNCLSMPPPQFFTGLLLPGEELPANVAGFANGTDVSVGVLLSRPVYNGTAASLRFDYRVADVQVEDGGRRKLLQAVVSRDLLVLSRVHVTGTMNTVVQRNLELPSDLAQVSRSDVAVVSRQAAGSGGPADSVSRSFGDDSGEFIPGEFIPMRIAGREWMFPNYHDEDGFGRDFASGEFFPNSGNGDWQDGG
ncbi:MAG: hypothetical protein VX563_00015, partial [Planctomycetota bacterium]|nr:hypothetical protein [Planctomycetota bacterium]